MSQDRGLTKPQRDAIARIVMSRPASSPFPYFWTYRSRNDKGLYLRKVAQSNLRRAAEREQEVEANKAALVAEPRIPVAHWHQPQ